MEQAQEGSLRPLFPVLSCWASIGCAQLGWFCSSTLVWQSSLSPFCCTSQVLVLLARDEELQKPRLRHNGKDSLGTHKWAVMEHKFSTLVFPGSHQKLGESTPKWQTGREEALCILHYCSNTPLCITKECTVVPHLLCVVEGFLHVLSFHSCTFLQLYKHFYLLCNMTRHIYTVPVCGMLHKNRKKGIFPLICHSKSGTWLNFPKCTSKINCICHSAVHDYKQRKRSVQLSCNV